MWSRWCCLVCSVIACGPAATAAREIVVTPGSIGAPALAAALDAAAPGDTIRLRKGVYCETITITKPVALVGDPGAVLDPSQPLGLDWKPATAMGKGVYRAAANARPRVLCLGGKLVAEIDERRKETRDEAGPWYWKKLLAGGPRLGGLRFVRAVWIYRSDEKAIYVHLADDADPALGAWSSVPSGDAVVAFNGASDASVSGLTIAHGTNGVVFQNGARRCSIAHCMIGPWDKNGILFTSGAADCLAVENEIFRGAYEDWVPHNTSKELYEIWQIHKEAGFYDRVGINLVQAGARNQVRANHVYQTFDGINVGDSSVESLDIPLKRPDDGRDTEIVDNLIEDTRDSGIELGVGGINVKVHHNVLRRTHGGLRFKLPRIGPVFIYRNVLIDGRPFNIWYSMDSSTALGYVYHNTIIGGQTALAYGFHQTYKLGAPNWHYVNNLVIGPRGFFGGGRGQTPVDFTVDYNVVTGGHKPYAGDPQKDVHSRYVDAVPLAQDFPPEPSPGSPAVDAGLDLSTYFHGRPLPGCDPGYFRGKAPDAGAYEVQ